MCVIAYKPAGVKVPAKLALKNCFTSNPNGAGIMFYDPAKDRVIIIKGLMTFSNFWTVLQNVRKTVDLDNLATVFHFRIATHGGINIANTHPFPVTDNEDRLKATRLACHTGIAHNGIIYGCKDTANILSDTQVFIRDWLYPLTQNYPVWYADPIVSKLIVEYSRSKFVVLHKNEGYMIGDFIKDNGVFYSNRSFESWTSTTTTVTGNYYWTEAATENRYWRKDGKLYLWDKKELAWVFVNEGKKESGNPYGTSLWWTVDKTLRRITTDWPYICPECGLHWTFCKCGYMFEQIINEFNIEEMEYLLEKSLIKGKHPLYNDIYIYLYELFNEEFEEFGEKDTQQKLLALKASAAD